MAEIKNAFIKSKMNKDLDARLVPSGEYRDAMNISISQSEGGDVGAVENVKGNELKTLIQSFPAVADLVVIGNLMDDHNNYIYIFSTNWTGTGRAPSTAACFIHRYNANNNEIIKLVEGDFLNFSTQNFISGVNLLENLLFFTDNRNQPRVINVDSAVLNGVGFYTREENVSVAKLAPFKAISLLSTNPGTVIAVTNPNSFSVDSATVVYPGDFITKGVLKVGVVATYTSGLVVVDTDFAILAGGDEVAFSRSGMINRTQEFLDDYNGNSNTPTVNNPNYNINWDGDPDFIKDKFIRFAYRYKFTNNEYSIISPFTATLFIPKQFGYFVGEDEERTYKSSIVAFMENYSQEMALNIPFPSKDPLNDYKISEVDIIYKESDGLALQVLSTLQVDQIDEATEFVGDDNYFSFSYESKKPYKTLPEDDLIRVYDRVPIKAKAQEVISNRVVYANYVDKQNFPNSIDYYVLAQKKDYGRYENTAQYPYHSLKQSRTYQLGFVLSDKYGRTSSVILSTKDINGSDLGRGSTYFHRYSDAGGNTPVTHPYGDALRVTVEGIIPEASLANGEYPGAYADSTANTQLSLPQKVWTLTSGSVSTISTNTYTIDQDLTTKLFVGNSLQGKFMDYVEITSITEAAGITTIVTSGQVADYYGDATASDLAVYGYVINPLGWYSYKVVVKQTEQEYYNVYLPGIINGTFKNFNTTIDVNQSSQAVLINDNINKIPRDLSEVGPQQKKFRSSVRLYGRVTPTYIANATTNQQWYPAKASDNVSEIADAQDFGYTPITDYDSMYDVTSNPLIAKIATLTTNVGGSQISIGSLPIPVAGDVPVFKLGVYETTPVETRLELFYETGSSGLISILNKETANTSTTGASDVVNYEWSLLESDEASIGVPFECTINDFSFVNAAGAVLDGTDIAGVPSIINVIDGNGTNVTSGSPFTLVDGSTPNVGLFKIETTSTFPYLFGSDTANSYTFEIQVDNNGLLTQVFVEGDVTNVVPSLLPNYTTEWPDWPDFEVILDDSLVFDFENPLIVTNGTSILSQITNGLVYTVTAQTLVGGGTVTNFGFTGGSLSELSIVDQTGIQFDDTYNVTVQIADASGSGIGFLTHDIDLTVKIINSAINLPADTQAGTSGNGCYGSAVQQLSQLRIFTIGMALGGSGWDSSLPTGADTSHGESQGVVSTMALTSGAIRLNLNLPVISCAPALGTEFVQNRTWVQYRVDSSSPWVNATDMDGFTWSGSGTTIVFNPVNPSPNPALYVEEILGDYDITGEYRIIVNPDIGGVGSDYMCGSAPGGTCVDPRSFIQNQLNYCDVNFGC